ncbi:hypothetical protein [Acinetobacter sp. 10FS3-1]|uniref:hypothetical protein n=1 Tax=Acinetobacter sp. 10FS3-1 TaxID=2563897 RepID=UPI00157E0804|nr:hypothetical protein [Acinetobacter sp. 10FS3-1]QKQ70669.1 hypothetical protein E5Y90_10745 [Acinetobacter sp. 10FS3-1]
MNGVWTAPPTLKKCLGTTAAYAQPYLDNLMIITGGFGFHTPRARAIAQHESYQHVVINLSAAIPLCIRYHFWLGK